MTIRDIAIAFGFEIDVNSEKKVNNVVNNLKAVAVKALSAIGVKFETDKSSEKSALDSVENIRAQAEQLADNSTGFSVDAASEQQALDSIGAVLSEAEKLAGNKVAYEVDTVSQQKSDDSISGLKDSAKPLERNPVGYVVDKSSEKAAVDSMKRLRGTASKILGAIGVGFSVVKVADMTKKFIAANEDMQAAVAQISDEWGKWKKGINDTFGIAKALAKFMTRAFSRIMGALKKLQTWTERAVKVFGGAKNMLKAIAIAGGAIFAALKADKILSALKSMSKLAGAANLKFLAIAAVIAAVALLVDDFINFMRGNDSLLGEMLKTTGIDADAVRRTITETWEAIKAATAAVWKTLKATAVAVFKGLSAFWKRWGNDIKGVFTDTFGLLLTVIRGLSEFITGVFSGDWGGIKTGLSRLSDFFKDVWEGIKGIFGGVSDFFGNIFTNAAEGIKNAFSGIKEFFGNLFEAVANVVKAPINWIIGGINGFIDGLNKIKIPDWVPVVGGKGLSFPTIPELAEGGVLEKGQTGFLEGSGAEAVVPLEKNTEWISKVAAQFKNNMPPGDADALRNIADTIVKTSGAIGNAVKSASEKIIAAIDAITADSPGLIDAIRSFSSDIALLAKSAAASPGTAQTMVTNTANRSVVQNNYFENTFNGDRAGQKRSAEAIGRSAKDASGELARALAFAR